MPSCVAYGCSNRSGGKTKRQKLEEETRKITYHKFPRCPEKCKTWIQAVNRDKWTPSPSSVICSVHFEEKFIDRTSLASVRLRENAVPTIFKSSYMRTKTATRKRKLPKERMSIEPMEMPSTSTEVPLDITDFEMESIQTNIFTENSTLDISISPRRCSPVKELLLKKNDKLGSIQITRSTSISPRRFQSPVKDKLRKRISTLNSRYRQKIRVLQNAQLRHKKKIASLQNVISALRNKKLFEENLDILPSISGPNKKI